MAEAEADKKALLDDLLGAEFVFDESHRQRFLDRMKELEKKAQDDFLKELGKDANAAELKEVIQGIKVGDKGKIENFDDSMQKFDALEAKLEVEKQFLLAKRKELGLPEFVVDESARNKFYERMGELEEKVRVELHERGVLAKAKWEGEGGFFENLEPLEAAHKKGSLLAKVDKILVEAGDKPRSIAELQKIIDEVKQAYPHFSWDINDDNKAKFIENMKELRAKAAAAEEFKFPHFDVEARPKQVVKAKNRKGYPRVPRDEVLPPRDLHGKRLPKRKPHPDPNADADRQYGAPVKIVVQDAPLRQAQIAHAAIMQAVLPMMHGLPPEPIGPNIFQALRMDRYGRVLPPDAKAPAPRPPPDEKSKTVSDVKTPSTSTPETEAWRRQQDAPAAPVDVAWDVHEFPFGRLGVEARRPAVAADIPAGMDLERLRREELVEWGLRQLRQNAAAVDQAPAPVAGLAFDERFDMPLGRGHWGLAPRPVGRGMFMAPVRENRREWNIID